MILGGQSWLKVRVNHIKRRNKFYRLNNFIQAASFFPYAFPWPIKKYTIIPMSGKKMMTAIHRAFLTVSLELFTTSKMAIMSSMRMINVRMVFILPSFFEGLFRFIMCCLSI